MYYNQTNKRDCPMKVRFSEQGIQTVRSSATKQGMQTATFVYHAAMLVSEAIQAGISLDTLFGANKTGFSVEQLQLLSDLIQEDKEILQGCKDDQRVC